MPFTVWVGDVEIPGDSIPFGITKDGVLGWYDLPALKTEFEGRVGGHGAYPVVKPWYAARVVTINVGARFRSRGEYVEMWERLNAMHSTVQRVRVQDENSDTFITGVVETQFPVGWTWDKQHAAITVTAPDPLRYSMVEQHMYLQSWAASVGGFEYSVAYPVDYHGGEVSGLSGIVTNRGNADTAPVITMHGNLQQGFILQDDRGRALEYHGEVLNGSPVVLDCARHTMLVSGVNRAWQLTRREWFTLPAHSSLSISLILREEVAPGQAWAEVSTRDAWL